jgi:serine/threonine protein kinase
MKFGQYELLERIAMGGMAEVYKGRVVGVEGFEKLVAIKRILPDLSADERFVTMLLTEARIHSALSHRNIVQIHDLGISEEGEYFIVLEYVEGYDLRAIMESIAAEGEIIPEALSLHIAAEVAQALQFAHELRGPDGQPLGLVHRDVSPSNVLISFAGEVKLSDFGLAKRRHDRSVVGSLKGNLIYMSPEQARQVSLDRRTDVFSLGAVLFELLTGQRLREITDEMKGWGEVAAGVVRSARSVRQDLPESISWLLDRALAADPAQRFADAGVFGAAIREILAQMNTPVGPGDLQALLSLVTPPRKLRTGIERSKVIRLAPEVRFPKYVAAPAPLAHPRSVSQVVAPGMTPPAKPTPRPRPPLTDDEFPPTPPPMTAAPPARTTAPRAPAAAASPRAPAAAAPPPLARSADVPTPPPAAPPRGRQPTPAVPVSMPARGRQPTPAVPVSMPARGRQPTPDVATPPGPVAVARPRQRPLPAATPLPTPPFTDWSDRATPPPEPAPQWEEAAAFPAQQWDEVPALQPQGWDEIPVSQPQSWDQDAAFAPTMAAPQTWQPAAAQTWQPASPMQDFPPPRAHHPTTKVQILPSGLWRPMVVAVAALVVLAALAVHLMFIPLDVLYAWRAPATLYVASEPEGGAVLLDGARLGGVTPTRVEVRRDRLEHRLEIEYPGFRPAREVIRYDRSVTLSALIALQKEGGPPIGPVGTVPPPSPPAAVVDGGQAGADGGP